MNHVPPDCCLALLCLVLAVPCHILASPALHSRGVAVESALPGWFSNAAMPAGAAFLQALADFRHECVSTALQGPNGAYFEKQLRIAREALHKQSATDATIASATSPPLALNGSTDSIDVQAHAADSQSSEQQPRTNGVSASGKTKAKT